MHKSRLGTIVIDCQGTEVARDAAFWGAALGAEVRVLNDPLNVGYRALEMPADQPTVLVQQVEHASRVHIDIETDDIEAEVGRLEALGATRVAQIKRWWVMQAPTGQRCWGVRPQREDFAENANVWP
jgi:hypothetical protein